MSTFTGREILNFKFLNFLALFIPFGFLLSHKPFTLVLIRTFHLILTYRCAVLSFPHLTGPSCFLKQVNGAVRSYCPQCC